MPTVRNPCINCRKKHARCDENRPSCLQCRRRAVECIRESPKNPFRPGSSAQHDSKFPRDQNWVYNVARKFHRHPPDMDHPVFQRAESNVELPKDVLWEQDSSPTINDHSYRLEHTAAITASLPNEPWAETITSQNLDQNSFHQSPSNSTDHCASQGSIPTYNIVQDDQPLSQGTCFEQEFFRISTHSKDHQLLCSNCTYYTSYDNIQEACLWRYFVEKLSPWFDNTDSKKHFQMVIPVHARHYQPLANAMFAVAARHLVRQPQYHTPRGVVYHGQLLPSLGKSTAVEYMLKCMPALKKFQPNKDFESRSHVLATAVILRQFEEIEDYDDDDDNDIQEILSGDSGYIKETVSFLDIINAVVRSTHAEGPLHSHGLFEAAYWMAIRQEVFYAFTRGHAPRMFLAPMLLGNASTANRMVLHASQVAKWLWEGKSEHEWLRLKQQERMLSLQYSEDFRPILMRPPDKSIGEVFPTIWLDSDIFVTGIQHLLIAKMVLSAEMPPENYNCPNGQCNLGTLLTEEIVGGSKIIIETRTAHQRAESWVRAIILNLCGIAVNRPQCPPALVNAIMGIKLYGDFFTDSREREALVNVIETFKNIRAWPVPNSLRTFK